MILAFIGTVLVIVGYFYSAPASAEWIVLINRALAIVTIWITAILLTKYKSKTDELAHKHHQLVHALEAEIRYSNMQQKFVSLVSHEFRTPLTIIDSTAQRIMRLNYNLTPQQFSERCTKIRNAVERMVELIDTTLYASRLDAGKIEMHLKPHRLQKTINDVVNRQEDISPSHTVHSDLSGLPDSILCDAKLMEHVFTNLLSNAVKYAPNNDRIEIRGWSEGDKVLVSVKDFGVGIPADDMAHMFERYFRAKTANGIKGSGLGLSVCREFVEMHGGDISLDSIEGGGSTFTVSLPIEGGTNRRATAY